MKNFAKVLSVGMIIGVFMTMLKIGYKIEDGVFFKYYFLAGGLIILLVFAASIAYVLYINNKVKEAVQFLNNDEVDKYVEAMEKLLMRAKGKNLTNMLRINLSVGYLELKEYKKAIKVLEMINFRWMREEIKFAYFTNLCSAYFHSSQFSKAIQLYESSLNTLNYYLDKQSERNKIALKLLEIFYNLATKNNEEAEQKIQALKAFDNLLIHQIKELEYLESLLSKPEFFEEKIEESDDEVKEQGLDGEDSKELSEDEEDTYASDEELERVLKDE